MFLNIFRWLLEYGTIDECALLQMAIRKRNARHMACWGDTLWKRLTAITPGSCSWCHMCPQQSAKCCSCLGWIREGPDLVCRPEFGAPAIREHLYPSLRVNLCCCDGSTQTHAIDFAGTSLSGSRKAERDQEWGWDSGAAAATDTGSFLVLTHTTPLPCSFPVLARFHSPSTFWGCVRGCWCAGTANCHLWWQSTCADWQVAFWDLCKVHCAARTWIPAA